MKLSDFRNNCKCHAGLLLRNHVFSPSFFGGWVAKNIFYLGHSGVIRVGPPGCGLAQTLRIAGLSGIYKGYDFHRGARINNKISDV